MDKEFYNQLIKKCGEYLKNHSEDYLQDFDTTNIAELEFIISIEPESVPAIELRKKYFPKEVL